MTGLFGDVSPVIDTNVLESYARQQRRAECKSVAGDICRRRDCFLQLPDDVDPPLTLAMIQTHSVVPTSRLENDRKE